MEKYDFSINIFCSRESNETILKTFKCALTAAENSCRKVLINILANGNKEIFKFINENIKSQFLRRISNNINLNTSVYYFYFGDKANTWNQYFHLIKPIADFHVFIDGYVYLKNETLSTIQNSFNKYPFIAATGVPTIGRSAKALKEEMIKHGGIHGNLCILTDVCLNQLILRDFKIPLNLYRTDPLIGAVINFNFSPKNNVWDSYRVCVIPELTWDVDEKSIFNYGVLISHLKRKLRQVQGSIENKALTQLFRIKKIDICELPSSVQELSYNYIKSDSTSFVFVILHPIEFLIRRKIIKEFCKLSAPTKSFLENHEVERY